MIQKWPFRATKIHYTVNTTKSTPRPLSLWNRVLIMITHNISSQSSEQPNPCMGYTHHLSVHRLRQVLDLHHGNPMHQPNKVCVDVLEHTLHIHTRYIITSPPSTVSRKSIQSSRTNICVYMTSINMCHHPKTCFLISLYQKIQKIK